MDFLRVFQIHNIFLQIFTKDFARIGIFRKFAQRQDY